MKGALKIIFKNIKKIITIVSNYTVYPGVTEEICIPIIEKSSKVVSIEPKDFFVGYSPERISPGKIIRNYLILKILISMHLIVEKVLKKVYSKIFKTGFFMLQKIL